MLSYNNVYDPSLNNTYYKTAKIYFITFMILTFSGYNTYFLLYPSPLR